MRPTPDTRGARRMLKGLRQWAGWSGGRGASGMSRGLRRRVGWLCCAVLALSALLVPAGSAAGESPAPTQPSAATSGPALRPLNGETSGPHRQSVRPPDDERSRIERDISRVLSSSPGAVRTGPFQVSWHGGAVVSTWLPRDPADAVDPVRRPDAPGATDLLASGVGGCPEGTFVDWFCFYEHAGFGGRMLQFRDCPSTQSLAAYGFANQTTSWVNNRSDATITVYDGTTSGTVLWREYGRSSSANVGSWANDRADTFTCRT